MNLSSKKKKVILFFLSLPLSYLTMAEHTSPKIFIFQKEENRVCAKAKYEHIQRVLHECSTREF